VAGGLLLGIRLRFHNHTPQQLATFLALHQQAADQVGGNLLGGAGEEGWGEDLKVPGGRSGTGSCWLSEWLGGWLEATARVACQPRRRIVTMTMHSPNAL